MSYRSDPRLTFQEQYLKNQTFYRRTWKRRSPEHDHDHCEFCWEKFSDAPNDLCEGYTTGEKNRNPHLWICPTCFRDFREALGFRTDETGE